MGKARGVGLGVAVPRRDGRRWHLAIGRFDGRVEEADSWRKDSSKCPSWTSSPTEVLRANSSEDSARTGAKLAWNAWNPAESGAVELTSDWFETIVRPTGLDAVLASREAQK